MEIVSGDNLHIMPKPLFRKNKKNIINLSIAELSLRVVKFDLQLVKTGILEHLE